VLSTRVNKIKDDLSWQIIEILADASEANHGLTALEWKKMWRLVSTAVTVEHFKVVRECLAPANLPGGLMSVWSLDMQGEFVPMLGLSLKIRNDFWNYVRSGVPPKHFEAMDVFRELVSAYARTTPVKERSTKDLFSADCVWASFKGWWSYFTVSNMMEPWCAHMLEDAVSSGNTISTDDFRHAQLCLDTRGYN
jgi:hypothetical protein